MTLRHLAVLLLTSGVIFTQDLTAQQQSAFGSITSAGNGTDCSVAAACVSILVPYSAGAASIQLSGTFMATIQLETSVNGTNWVSSQSMAGTGIYSVSLYGSPFLRVRASSFSSGLVVVNISTSGGSSSTSAAPPTLGSTGFPSAFTTQPGSAVIANTALGVVLTEPDFAADNINGSCKAAPVAPYTLTGKFVLSQDWNGDSWGGFAWRDSGTGKYVAYGLLAGQTGVANVPAIPTVYSIDFSNPTTFAGTSEGHNNTASNTAWVQISDDGTHAIERWSADGLNYLQVSNVTKSAGYLGATGYNQVCLFVSAHGSAAALTMQSFSQTTP